MTSPRRLAPDLKDKIWGTPLTEPWHPNPQRVQAGEVWFTPEDDTPLLVKFLFTSDKLSIQVHPDDEYARKHGHPRGKTEMWHILRADPGAKVGVGLREPINKHDLREAALNGEIEHLVHWRAAVPGDTFLIPAGTIHAIGGGLALCEVQQLSDATYRLFDYNRLGDDGNPRMLHLDDGIAVARLRPNECAMKSRAIGNGRELLAESPYFRTERLRVEGTARVPEQSKTALYIVLEGEGSIAGEKFAAGDAWQIPALSGGFEISSPRAVFLVTGEP